MNLRLRLMTALAAGALAISGSADAHGAHRAAGHAAALGHFGRGAPIEFATMRGRAPISFSSFGRFGRHGGGRRMAAGHSGGRLQCVTFARADSGIELSGNASAWWYNAEGVYQRGQRPEAGAVLNFRANGRMRMGHVAVVNQIVDSRTIEIEHANWRGPGSNGGGIARDIRVVDVSPGNDWTAVRVSLGQGGEFGSVYPTYGFIYNRPDRGTLVANASAAPVPSLNPAPNDLRPAHEQYDEVAEAPDDETVAPVHSLRHGLRHRVSATVLHHHHHRGHSRA